MNNTLFTLFRVADVLVILLMQSGCYVGTMTNVTARELEYPVSFTDVLLDENHNRIYESGYEKVSDFSFSYHQIGWASPLKISKNKDISKRLNKIIRDREGDAVINLTISTADSPLNGLMIGLKTVAYFGIVIGAAIMLGKEGSTLTGAAVFGASAASIVLLPGFTHMKIEGTVVRFNHSGS